MSGYKIYAKKGRKVMPIKIEEKHIYQNPPAYTDGVPYANNQDVKLKIYKSQTNPTFSEFTRGYGPNSGTIQILHNTNSWTIAQGTADDQRVGNKVNIKSVSLTLNLHIDPTILINSFGHSELVDMKFHFRIMCVKFNNPIDLTNEQNELANWYKNTFVYYRTVSSTGGDKVPVQSNWMDKIRNSSTTTGSYKILFDKKFSLTKFKTVKQKQINLPIKGNANFDNDTNELSTNQPLSNIYTFIIGPSNNWLDMDAISTSKIESYQYSAAELFIYNANIKTIYYDI